MPEIELAEMMKDWDSYVPVAGRGRGATYERRLAETIDLITNARGVPAHRHEYEMREALTTSDFPLLFGDVLDRQVLASYKAADPVWKLFTKLSTNRDFRASDRYAISGGDDALEEVTEKGEYQASPRTEAKYSLTLKKYGRQFDISWEALINDDLGALKDTPERFAKAAIRREHRLVTALYAHNVTLATAGRGNLSTNLLTIANLETALEWYGARTDANGEAIPTVPKFLVVPPALEMTARQILTSASKMWLQRGDTDNNPLPFPTNNVVSQMGLILVVDPYLPIIDTTTLTSATGWYLFTDPSELTVIEAAHLRGHERPEIVMKASDKVMVGGGVVSPMDGDFATDNVFYRVRLPFGGTTLDWRGFYFGGHSD